VKHKEYKTLKVINCPYEFSNDKIPATPPQNNSLPQSPDQLHEVVYLQPPPLSYQYSQEQHQLQQQYQMQQQYFMQQPPQQLYQPQQQPLYQQYLPEADDIQYNEPFLNIESLFESRSDLQELCYIEEDGELEQEIGDIASVNRMREIEKARVTEASIRHGIL